MERLNSKGKHLKEKILKLQSRNSYLRVTLTKDMIRKTFSVNRLVALMFIPNPEKKKEVNHKDTNKRK